VAPIFVEMKANISEFKAKMGEASEEIEHLSKKGSGSYSKLQSVGKAALFGLGGIAVAAGAMGVKAAIEGEAAHARLAQAIKNAGGSMEQLEPHINKLSDRFANLGFTNDEVETGLANMTTALRDPQKAMESMGMAADLARFKHISLADASTVVAKAMEGQLKPLKQLGIDLPVAAGGALKLEQAHDALAKAQAGVNAVVAKYPDAASKASKHHAEYERATAKVEAAQAKLKDTQSAATEITKGLASAVGGQAVAASETWAGKIEALRAKSENLVEKLGNALLPVITSVIAATVDVVTWFEHHKTTAEALGIVVGTVLVGAIGAYIAGLAIAAVQSAASFVMMIAGALGWSTATSTAAVAAETSMVPALLEMLGAAWTWATGMLAAGATALLPFLPLIAIVAVLGVAAYELYKHWDTVWSGIKTAVGAAWNFIKDHFVLILTVALGPLGFAIAELGKHWDAVWSGIKTAVGAAWGFLKTVFGFIVGAGILYVKTEIKILETVWHAVWSSVQAVLHAVWGSMKAVFDAILTGGIWLVKREISGLQTVWQSVWGTVKSVVSEVWDFLEPIFSKISKGIGGIVGAVGKVSGFVGKIPGFRAGGGPVSAGEPYIVGENGPELIVPGRSSYVVSNDALRASGAGVGRPMSSGSGGGDVVQLTVQSMLDGRVIGETVHTFLLQKKARGGDLGLAS
jgi:hypothetical protein